MGLTDIKYRGNGFTATFDNGSVANGIYKVVNGVLTIIGLTDNQLADLQVFNATVNIDDARFSNLSSLESDVATLQTDVATLQAEGGGGGGGGGGITTITTTKVVSADDNGKIFYVPFGTSALDFTITASLSNEFTFTVVDLSGNATVTPASGEKLCIANAIGSADQKVNFTSGNHATWVLDRTTNTWIPTSVASGVGLIAIVLEAVPEWQLNSNYDPSDELKDITSVNIPISGGGVSVRCYDTANDTDLDISPGSGIVFADINGSLDLTPLTIGSDVTVGSAGWVIEKEGDGNTNLANGILHIKETSGGTGSTTLSVENSNDPGSPGQNTLTLNFT